MFPGFLSGVAFASKQVLKTKQFGLIDVLPVGFSRPPIGVDFDDHKKNDTCGLTLAIFVAIRSQ